jgi:HopA1 effector protein family
MNRSELAAPLGAIVVHSYAALTFGGRLFQVAPATPPMAVPYPVPPNPLVRDLMSALYTFCYTRRFTGHVPNDPVIEAAPDDPRFVANLSAANQSTAKWDPGWSVYAVGPNGQAFVQKGEVQRSVWPGEYLSAGPPGMPVQVGTTVHLFVQRESTALQPGLYYAFGETPSDAWDEFHLLRFYFHVTSDGVASVFHELSKALNRYRVPFRMKTLTDSRTYDRADAAVLYLARRYYELTVRLVRALSSHAADQLRETTPLFTLPIARGVGVAEEPDTGESFGMHRCRLMAEGIVDAFEQHSQSVDDRLTAVERRFAMNGLDLTRPYLAAGSVEFGDVVDERSAAHA